MGMALLLCLPCGVQSHPAGFYEQLRSSPVLAVLGEVVFVGYCVHRRTGVAGIADCRADPARIVLTDQRGDWRTSQGTTRTTGSRHCARRNGSGVGSPGL